MEKPRTYRDVLEHLKISPDTPETKTCRMCGEPMHLTKVNDQVCFWIHKGESIKICGEKNVLNKGYPLIARNMQIYRDIKDLWSKLRGEG